MIEHFPKGPRHSRPTCLFANIHMGTWASYTSISKSVSTLTHRSRPEIDTRTNPQPSYTTEKKTPSKNSLPHYYSRKERTWNRPIEADQSPSSSHSWHLCWWGREDRSKAASKSWQVLCRDPWAWSWSRLIKSILKKKTRQDILYWERHSTAKAW